MTHELQNLQLAHETLERNYRTVCNWADELAAAIAAHLHITIGQHSLDNCPWQNAISALQQHEEDPSNPPWLQSALETLSRYHAGIRPGHAQWSTTDNYLLNRAVQKFGPAAGTQETAR